MHFPTILSVSLTTLASLAHAADQVLGKAIVVNKCNQTIYLWSVGSSAGPEQFIAKGKNYTETFHQDKSTGGVALKITNVEDGLYFSAPQTIFAYNLVDSKVWYDLSDVFGDPFEGDSVKVEPSEPAIHWTNGVPPAGSQVRVHNAAENIVLTFC